MRTAPSLSPRWPALLAAVGALLLAVAARGQEAGAPEIESDPPGRVARLSHIEGDVTFAPAGTDEWAEAVVNRPMTSEDRLSVGADGRAELQVGQAAVHLDRNTQFGFIELDDDVMQMSLVEGAATLRVRRLGENETIKVETPNVTVDIRSVGEYHLQVDPASDQTIVKTRSGEALVMGGASQRYTVRAHEQGIFRGFETLTAEMGAIPPRTPFEEWANERERRAQQAESARYVSRDVVGYEDLDDHGEWLHEPEYGYVWRPRYVVHDWAPYRFGRWAWISPWGWTWIDDAPWGFAPFHYGRWVHIRHRWCWVPGPRHLRPIYAPALVGWLGPSVSVSVSLGHGIGWYPLAPHDIYIPGHRHTPRYIRRVNISNTIIVNNTFIDNVYRRGLHPDHRYRRHVHAVTAVHQDHFAGGRPIGRHRVHVDERALRDWRADPRPPAIAPYRESVLAGEPRERRRTASHTTGANRLITRNARRIDFAAERRAIESNGGRPVSRAELFERPGKSADFRVGRRHAEDVKRAERRHVDRSGEAARFRTEPRAPARESSISGRERLDIRRADESRSTRALGGREPSTRRMEQAPALSAPTVRGRSEAPAARSYGNALRSRESSPSPGVRRSAPPGRTLSTPSPRQPSAAPEQRSRSHQASPPRGSSSFSRGDSGRSSSRSHRQPR